MFTETYIEMVINNPDIQSLCKYNKGDWFWNGEKPYLYCKSGLGSSNPHDYKWLPTLEDLFNLLEGKPIEDTWYFYKWIATENQKFTWVNTDKQSIKELLLHYVMFDKFNKSWNPEKKEWREINGS
jgi:hypothetical protein